MTDKPLHLVVRFSDTMFHVGDVVGLHNNVVDEHGAVWFGKLGQTISQKRVDLLNKQIEKQILTHLYLVKGNRKKSTVYKATLYAILKKQPEEEALIPSYYEEKGLVEFMKVWMRIGKIELIDFSQMSILRAINSINPIKETLGLSSSGYFLVQESTSLF